MRVLMFVLLLFLVQLLTYGLSFGLSWLVRPYATTTWRLMAGCFLLSNALFLAGFFGFFRLSANWLALLWLGFLAAMIAAVLIFLFGRFMNPLGVRALAMSCVLSLIGVSVFNAYMPTVRHLRVQIDKPVPVPVRLAVVSDLHLGSLFGVRELAILEQLLIKHQVDVLLMPGDIMDDNTQGFDSRQMAGQFKKTLAGATLSVASLGNHDLYQREAYEHITHAIKDAGALLLDDDTAVVAITKDGKTTHLQLVGRLDDHATGRQATADLLAHADLSLPVIVLDHRPSQIEQNSILPIDLQVSGHTHNGQLFPANVIVQAINRIGYGYERINGTHFVVSSGFGFWGVPLRLGSRSEIWVIDLVGH